MTIKIITAAGLAAILVALALTIGLTSGAKGQEPGPRFPYWTAGATSEDENESRIRFVSRQRAELRDTDRSIGNRIEQRKDRIAELRAANERSWKRRHKVRKQITRHSWLIAGMSEMRGIVATLAAIRTCESGGNYQESPSEGLCCFDGAYQFDGSTWRSNQQGIPRTLHVYRSYLAASWVQDWVAALLYGSRGNQPWPNCP